MAKALVSDELWEQIEPLLPPEPARPKGGHPRIPVRQVLAGILFVLETAVPWEDLPQEMGCGSTTPVTPGRPPFAGAIVAAV